MSANGELFIENLRGVAIDLGLFDDEEDYMKTPSKYYDIWNDRDIPKKGKIKLEDGSFLEFKGKAEYDEDFGYTYEIESITRNGETKLTSGEEYIDPRDWYIHLKPIVKDFLDGEPKLTDEDVDWLMPILRAKIEFYNGLITEEEYYTIINDTYN